MDIRALHRRAADSLVELVNTITASDLDRPTPCSEWSVRNLLEHQVVQNRGFALAASGQHSTLAQWQPETLHDPVARHAESTANLIAAFAADGVLDRDFWLPEIRQTRPIPASTAIGFHFLDCVVHGWDLAAALGVPPTVDADLAAAALPMAESVPDGPDARGPGRAFHASAPASPDMQVLDRVVALLGRDPEQGVTGQVDR